MQKGKARYKCGEKHGGFTWRSLKEKLEMPDFVSESDKELLMCVIIREAI